MICRARFASWQTRAISSAFMVVVLTSLRPN